jgi:uncharacterized protein (TIGR02246 family)
MEFRAALERHLGAIRNKDLAALADTVAPEELVLVMADGKVARRTSDFLEAHRGWFAMEGWRLDVHPIHVHETFDTGIAVLRLDYREATPNQPEVRQESILTLVFQLKDGKWRMVLDQNTPLRH